MKQVKSSTKAKSKTKLKVPPPKPTLQQLLDAILAAQITYDAAVTSVGSAGYALGLAQTSMDEALDDLRDALLAGVGVEEAAEVVADVAVTLQVAKDAYDTAMEALEDARVAYDAAVEALIQALLDLNAGPA